MRADFEELARQEDIAGLATYTSTADISEGKLKDSTAATAE
jgi:hypothetical protein